MPSFLEDLIDACLMECYFREHMLQRDLLFHDDVARLLEEAHAETRRRGEEKDHEEVLVSEILRVSAPPREPSPAFLRAFVSLCETSPIRNRLLRLTADSPDLLAVIKQEGRV